MGKLQLERPWEWNEQAEMFCYPDRPTRTDYPFWWYNVDGLKISLIKQVSKYFGVIFQENRYITAEQSAIVDNFSKIHLDDYDSDTAEEIFRRSWMTLGEYVPDDYENEIIIEYPSGGAVVFTIHPKIKKITEVTQCDADGVLTAMTRVNYGVVLKKNDKDEIVEERYYKSEVKVFDKRLKYHCESEKDKEWTETKNGKFVKKWIFRELLNNKMTDKTEDYETRRYK